MKVRTRFAPSPTGFLHIGSLRTALYAYALAKHSQGDFILRIEDTDQKREIDGSTKALQKTLQKFGIVWDEFYIQSNRHKTGIYTNVAEKFVREGNAFYCQCTPKNAKEQGFSKILRDKCRDKEFTSGAIKLKVPDNDTLSYHDFVHDKDISWNSNDVYDATLLKSDGFPTYHLAAMVDDIDMKISHIMRGHDWLPSTPIHLLIFKYLEVDAPQIGHLTDILSSSTGKKLSKRHDSVFVEQFLKDGYLPEALLNFLLLLGWAPNDNREIYSLDEFVDNFNESGFGDANPKFLTNKLNWFNSHYIQSSSDENLRDLIVAYTDGFFGAEIIGKTIPLIKTRIKTLSEYEKIAKFFFEVPVVDREMLGDNYVDHLTDALFVIESIRKFDIDILNDDLMKIIEKKGYKTGKFFMDLRIAITGEKFTPPINDSLIILGKDETISRIKAILK